jgi:hypothetical protein
LPARYFTQDGPAAEQYIKIITDHFPEKNIHYVRKEKLPPDYHLPPELVYQNGIDEGDPGSPFV